MFEPVFSRLFARNTPRSRALEEPRRSAVQPPGGGAVACRDVAEARPRTVGDHGSAVLRGKVRAVFDRMLAGTYTELDNARPAQPRRKHRARVLRFLDQKGVDATNNPAGREARPAVIARRLSAGNRTEEGAETHGVLAGVFRTNRARAGISLRRWSRCSGMARVMTWSSATPHRQSRPGERPGTTFTSWTSNYLHRSWQIGKVYLNYRFSFRTRTARLPEWGLLSGPSGSTGSCGPGSLEATRTMAVSPNGRSRDSGHLKTPGRRNNG
jgi:hypothetical protein